MLHIKIFILKGRRSHSDTQSESHRNLKYCFQPAVHSTMPHPIHKKIEDVSWASGKHFTCGTQLFHNYQTLPFQTWDQAVPQTCLCLSFPCCSPGTTRVSRISFLSIFSQIELKSWPRHFDCKLPVFIWTKQTWWHGSIIVFVLLSLWYNHDFVRLLQ